MLRFAVLAFITVNFSASFAYPAAFIPETSAHAPADLSVLPELPDFMALEKEIIDIIELANMPAMPSPNNSRAILPIQTMTYPQFSKRGRFYNSRYQSIPFPMVNTVNVPAIAYGQPATEMTVSEEKTAEAPAESVVLASTQNLSVESARVETAADSASIKNEVLQVVDNSLGKIYADNRGFTLYTYTADSENTSTCTGGCAVAWPPYFVEENQMANNEKLAEMTRPDGKKQWSFAGQPLYFYAADRAPGDAKGEKVANVWFVVKAE